MRLLETIVKTVPVLAPLLVVAGCATTGANRGTSTVCEPGFKITEAGYLGTGDANGQERFPGLRSIPKPLMAEQRAGWYIQLGIDHAKSNNPDARVGNLLYSKVLSSYETPDGTACVTILAPFR
jgi:hypothetical protein